MNAPTAPATLLFVDEETRALFAAQLQLEQAARLIRDAFAFAIAGTFAITAAVALL